MKTGTKAMVWMAVTMAALGGVLMTQKINEKTLNQPHQDQTFLYEAVDMIDSQWFVRW